MPSHAFQDLVIDATLYTLIAFSMISWTLIFFKIWLFVKNNACNKQYVEAFWAAKDLSAAEKLPADKAKGPKARIAASGFDWLAKKNESTASTSLKFHGCSPQYLLEQTLRKQALLEQKRIELGMTMLASIGSTAPFVGLFGTVVGIMHAMRHISETGSASLDVVAGPIGDALIATAIGIAVAVPAVLAYNFFLRQAKHHRTSLEGFTDDFLHLVFGDDLNNSNKE